VNLQGSGSSLRGTSLLPADRRRDTNRDGSTSPLRPAGDVGPYLRKTNCIAMATVGTVVPRCPQIVGEMRIVSDGPTPLRPAGDVGPYLRKTICIAMAKVGTVVPRCPQIVGEMRIVSDGPTPCGPPGTSGPILWKSRCIAMARVGTVVPRCPRIVGEMRIGTDHQPPAARRGRRALPWEVQLYCHGHGRDSGPSLSADRWGDANRDGSPTPCGPPGTSGSTLGIPFVVTEHTEAYSSRNQPLRSLRDLLSKTRLPVGLPDSCLFYRFAVRNMWWNDAPVCSRLKQPLQ